MVSVEGEVVELVESVAAGEAVEAWLAQLAAAMRRTLQQQLGAAGALPDPLRQVARQVLGLHQAVDFTARWGGGRAPGAQRQAGGGRAALQRQQAASACSVATSRSAGAALAAPRREHTSAPRRAEVAIAGGGVPALAQQLRAELQALARRDLGGSPLLQLRRQGLVLDYVHHLDVLDQLQQAQPAGPGDWAWSRQLRYYRQQVGRLLGVCCVCARGKGKGPAERKGAQWKGCVHRLGGSCAGAAQPCHPGCLAAGDAVVPPAHAVRWPKCRCRRRAPERRQQPKRLRAPATRAAWPGLPPPPPPPPGAGRRRGGAHG
jgi:hypothetical protein